jgi:hypothetical protein
MPTDNEPMAGDVYRRNGNWRQFHGVDSEGNVLFFTFGEQGVRKCGSAEWREWSRDATRVWPPAEVQESHNNLIKRLTRWLANEGCGFESDVEAELRRMFAEELEATAKAVEQKMEE